MTPPRINRDRPRLRASAALFLLLPALATPCLALTDEEIFRDFRFNLLNPGARSLGAGGAFISLADDATAAQANPAGLVHLRRPEMFAELRATSFDATETRTATPIETRFFSGEVVTRAVSRPDGDLRPAFLSWVLPMRRFALGLSRIESLDVRARAGNSFRRAGTRALFVVDPDTGRPIVIGSEPVDEQRSAEADVDARIDLYNVALAFDIHRRFSAGVTAVVGRLDIDGRVDNLFRDRTAAPGEPGFTPTMDYATRVEGSDTDLAFNAGLLWRPWDPVSIGAVYRGGSRFAVEQTIGESGASAAKAREIFGSRFENVIRTPDSWGLGVSVRPVEKVTFFVDALRVEYSDLLEEFRAGLNAITFPQADARFTVEDATEIHAGAEVIVVIRSTPVALRAGLWTDPDNRIRADGRAATGLGRVFPGRDRLTHATAGFGMTLKESIQLDVAADVSSATTAFVVSSIFRF